MREVKSINLHLENCEYYKVERKHIGELHIGKIERTIRRNVCNSISEDYSANEFHIQIHHDSNVNGFFDRILKYPDITQIEIEYSNDTKEGLFLNWVGDSSDQNNTLQTSIVSDVNGDLFIVVDENHNAESIFSYEIEEDDNFSWDMYEE